jgi:hypothetical protein
MARLQFERNLRGIRCAIDAMFPALRRPIEDAAPSADPKVTVPGALTNTNRRRGCALRSTAAFDRNGEILAFGSCLAAIHADELIKGILLAPVQRKY